MGSLVGYFFDSGFLVIWYKFDYYLVELDQFYLGVVSGLQVLSFMYDVK